MTLSVYTRAQGENNARDRVTRGEEKGEEKGGGEGGRRQGRAFTAGHLLSLDIAHNQTVVFFGWKLLTRFCTLIINRLLALTVRLLSRNNNAIRGEGAGPGERASGGTSR